MTENSREEVIDGLTNKVYDRITKMVEFPSRIMVKHNYRYLTTETVINYYVGVTRSDNNLLASACCVRVGPKSASLLVTLERDAFLPLPKKNMFYTSDGSGKLRRVPGFD